MDYETAYTENNIKMAEAAQGVKMSADFGMTDSTVATPRNYFVPDFGVDEDVKGVTEAIGNAESSLGEKMSADFGFTDSTVATPRDYFVPDFGVDAEVEYT